MLWAIRRVETGEMAGFTVALPRRVVVDGEVRTCWNGADFSILPKYRTLGLAMKLRRAAKEGVDGGRVDFLYAHPNERMAVIHAKVGHQPVGRVFRYAKPLRAGPYLRGRLKREALTATAIWLIDPLLRLGSREWRHRTSSDVRLVGSPKFDERYDRLFDESARCARVVGVRDGRYLNWRYAENPLYETHALEAREGNRLRGYLLFRVEGESASIKDVFPPTDESVARDLTAGMIREGRRRGLKSLSIATLEGNPLDPRFAEFGFRRRPESSEMFAYASPGCPWRDVVLDKQSWFVTVGDRDV
ncbi:MAG TPA: hypothetical protein VMY37_07005 [Thermoguttaceae bacterium]|nr:hypothetical protein [Thermoguttaceae bacterium]